MAVHLSTWRFADPDYKTNMHAATNWLVQKQKRERMPKRWRTITSWDGPLCCVTALRWHTLTSFPLYLLPFSCSEQLHTCRLLVVFNVSISSTSRPAASSDGFVMRLFWSDTCCWLILLHVASVSLFWSCLFSYNLIMVERCQMSVCVYDHRTYFSVYVSKPAVGIPQWIPAALAWTAPPPICNTQHR